MNIDALISIGVSIFILGLGGVLVKTFVTRTFLAIDEKMRDIGNKLDIVHSRIDALKKSFIAINPAISLLEKDIVRLQESSKIVVKLEDAVNSLEKAKIEKSDFLSEISEINTHLEKISEKVYLLLGKGE